MDFRVTWPVGLGLLLASGVVVSSAGGGSPPSVVTTDTPEYCQKLIDRISQAIQVASAPPPTEVSSLSSEGMRMCNDGLTRGGVLRLRRVVQPSRCSRAWPALRAPPPRAARQV
jgi:hypothetical protein